MENASTPSCSVSGGSRAPHNRDQASGDQSDAVAQQQQQQQEQQEHNIFGDSNLNMVMMFLLMLHFMQYAMRPPCGC
ncbi:hypothetical protein FI667_g2634, partial [Globisporangium splendens]